MDTLGDRIKRYEAVSNPLLTNNMPVFIRVDGKAFHTWTKGLNKPFDQPLINAMIATTLVVSKQMQGFRLAYTQSDEATFCLTDLDSNESQPWLANEVNKLVSITASMFTAVFNQTVVNIGAGPAFFDARAFNVPLDDAPNVFVWRQKDWLRNSIQMLARAHYSHKELHGKKHAEIHEMLHAKGVNWADLSPVEKNGTFITPTNVRAETLDWSEIIEYIDPTRENNEADCD